MPDAEIIRHLLCVFCLIQIRSREACHIRVLPVFVRALIRTVSGNVRHGADGGGRIQSAAESGSQSHIASHADLAGIQKQLAELLYLLLVGIRHLDQMIQCVPEACDLCFSIANPRITSSRESLDPLDQALRLGLIMIVRKITVEHLLVRFHLLKQREKRLHLRCKGESSVRELGVVKRLHAKTVPGEKQALFLSVPDGERPHSVKAVHAFFLPLAVRRHDHFRVAVSAERVSLVLQFLPDLDKIVYLTVKRHPVALIGVGHRLASGAGEI